jgi:hypothetical protein
VKIHIVKDYNEPSHTRFFGSKKNAIEYYNLIKDKSFVEFETIDVQPTKKGILRAMSRATDICGGSCGDLE